MLFRSHGAKGEARSAAANVLGDIYAEMEKSAGDLAKVRELAERATAELKRVDEFIAEFAGAKA